MPVPLLAAKVIFEPVILPPVAIPPLIVRAAGVPSVPKTILPLAVSTVSKPLPLAFCTWKAVVELVEACNNTFPVLPKVATAVPPLFLKSKISPVPLEAACKTPATEPLEAAWTLKLACCNEIELLMAVLLTKAVIRAATVLDSPAVASLAVGW